MNPDEMQFAKIAQELSSLAWSLVLIGNPPPEIKEEYDFMKQLKPGNLVAEISSTYRSGDKTCCIGWFERETWEPVPDWDEREDGPAPTERVYYIRLLNGEEYRWVNAQFISLPIGENRYMARRYEKEADSDTQGLGAG